MKTPTTTPPDELGAASGSAWTTPDAAMPETYSPLIVAGSLEDEDGYMATHESFWCGRNWWSVRGREETILPEKKRILNVTHWMPMPPLPNAVLSHEGSAKD